MTEQDRERSESGDALERVLQILKEIAEKSADGDYLYRGEPKHYCLVSSSLYRRREQVKIEGLDIEIAEKEILKAAKEFAGQMDEDDLLTHLQHFGSVTNLIDFTTDYLVALFFACDRKPEKDGRVILLKKNGHKLLKPRSPANRVIAQKSVFVRPPKGYIEDHGTVTVTVPHELKEPMLDYLNSCHGVSATTLYNDIHGFIRYHEGHESAYLEFYAAEAHVSKREYKAAIDRYSKAIKLNPQLTPAYNNRGNVYKDMRQCDRAIQDYNKAIKLNPNLAAAYSNRGVVYSREGKYDCAFQDYDRAIELDPRYAEAYYNRGNAFSDMGKCNCAIRDYDKALEIDSNYVEAYTNRAIAHIKIGNIDSAIQDLKEAIDLDPCNALAYNVRGAAYCHRCEYDRAIQDYTRAIELNPKYAAAYINRGIASLRKGDFGCSIQDLNCAIELNSNYGIAYYNLGLCRLCLREWDKARSNFLSGRQFGFDIVSGFSSEYENLAAFEKLYNVQLPSDIAALLLTSSCDE